jgi:DNA-binding MarR family transcriptional regulator
MAEPSLAAVTARAGYMMGVGAERNWSADHRLAWEGLLELYGRLRGGAAEALERNAGLGISALGLMGRLTQAPDHTLRQVELAEAMGLSLSRVSRVLDDLQHRNLIERRPCPSDARATNIVLTPAGLDLTAQAQATVFDYVDTHFAARLEPEEVEVLAGAFARLLSEGT